MNDSSDAAAAPMLSNWQRSRQRLRRASGDVWFWVKLRTWHRHLYRPVMRFAHRFGWHHAPIGHLRNENQWALCRCSWCGLSGFVMDDVARRSSTLLGPLGKGPPLRPNSKSPSQT